MIINTGTSSVEVIGDITEFKTGIDPKNLEFITTLLSSNLYSNPEQSFIREIVSNAWDSHVEAGTTDTPVLIKMRGNEITIRDYGTGLSPERFKEIYCNIGSSTKRESNAYHGAFGIGHLSVLSCTNTAYVTSYYNGVAYHYITIKDGNNITNNLVAQIETNEPNGVAVTIKNIYQMDKYVEALKYLVFFPNIYIDSDNIKASNINNCHIKHFNNFSASTLKCTESILLGNVLYPLNLQQLKREEITKYNYLIKAIIDSGVVFKFNIGELEVTPNRESIIYNTKTIEVIENRIIAACEEILDYFREYLRKDYTNLEEYVLATGGYVCIDFFKECIYKNSSASFGIFILASSIKDIINEVITYKGRPLTLEESNYYNIIRHYNYPKIKGFISPDNIYVGKIPNKFHSVTYIRNQTKAVIVPEKQRLSGIMKEYLKSKYVNHIIIEDTSYEEFKEIGNHKTCNEYILKEVYNNIIANSVFIDFDTNDDFKKYKEEYKALKTTNKPVLKNICIYKCYNYYKSKRTYKTIEEIVKTLKLSKESIILVPLEEWNNNYYDIARKYRTIDNVGIYTASKPVYKALLEEDLPTFNIEKSIFNRNSLSVLKTIITYYNIIFNGFLCKILPKKDKDTITYLRDVYKHASINKKDLCHTFDIPLNNEIVEFCERMLKLVNQIEKVKSEYSLNTDSETDLAFLCYYIMKNKLFRINYNYYQFAINNPVIKTLCKR